MPRKRAKPLAILVHGLDGTKSSWNQLLSLVRRDIELKSRFQFERFEYDADWFSGNRKASAQLRKAAKGLGKFVNSEVAADRRYVLIGHGLGGLVIEKFLADRLEAGRAAALANLELVVLLATPDRVSSLLAPSSNGDSAKSRGLESLAPEFEETLRVVREHAILARERNDGSWPIRFHFFHSKKAVRGLPIQRRDSDISSEVLPGDDGTIICPDNHDDPSFQRFKAALLCPPGHTHLFEVAQLSTTISVAPLADDRMVRVKYGGKTMSVDSDNVGRILREVTFSANNRCRDRFQIRYSTREGGYVQPKWRGANNEWLPAERGRFEDYGNECSFVFRPATGSEKSYSLDVTIYRGFDEGNRNVHFHLGRRTHYHQLAYTLDLTGYVGAGFRISQTPRLYLHETDPEDHRVCKQRELSDSLKPASVDRRGIWRWELADVREGVVDIVWDVT